jgi:hypothetical protein
MNLALYQFSLDHNGTYVVALSNAVLPAAAWYFLF